MISNLELVFLALLLAYTLVLAYCHSVLKRIEMEIREFVSVIEQDFESHVDDALFIANP